MDMMKARTHSTHALPSLRRQKQVDSLRKSIVMVRCCRVGLAAVPMCPPRVSRSRQRMRHTGGHALKSQAHCERLRASPLNARVCGRFYAGQECDFDVQLILDAAEVSSCRLGETDDYAPRLGWSTWLKVKEFSRDAEDTVLAGHLSFTQAAAG
jgi:hypothetical protein